MVVWWYGELGRYVDMAFVCLKNWFTGKTITNHVSKAYCVKIHCQNLSLQNDVCTAQANPTLESGSSSDRLLQKIGLEIFHGIIYTMGLYNLILVAIFDRRAYAFLTQCESYLNIRDIQLFHFKMYISAVFGLTAMNLTPYSPTVTWQMCAEFDAFTISGTKMVKATICWSLGVRSSCIHCSQS